MHIFYIFAYCMANCAVFGRANVSDTRFSPVKVAYK